MNRQQLLQKYFDSVDLLEACEELVNWYFRGVRRGTEDDLDQLVHQLNVPVQIIDGEKFDGCYSWDANGERITICRHPVRRRVRFTLAHELGHCLLRRFALA